MVRRYFVFLKILIVSAVSVALGLVPLYVWIVPMMRSLRFPATSVMGVSTSIELNFLLVALELGFLVILQLGIIVFILAPWLVLLWTDRFPFELRMARRFSKDVRESEIFNPVRRK